MSPKKSDNKSEIASAKDGPARSFIDATAVFEAKKLIRRAEKATKAKQGMKSAAEATTIECHHSRLRPFLRFKHKIDR